MIKAYIAYLKDNPEKYWFRAKLYGWGWTPARLQGWAVLFFYLIIVAALVIRLIRIQPEPPITEALYSFFLPFGILTLFFILIAYITGERPHWQWGIPKKYKEMEGNNQNNPLNKP